MKMQKILGLFLAFHILNAKDFVESSTKTSEAGDSIMQLEDLPKSESSPQDAMNLNDTQNLLEANDKDDKNAKNDDNDKDDENALFPLLDTKTKARLFHNDYLDSNNELVAPKPLEPLSLLPLEEWRGNYVLYLYRLN